MKHIYLAFVIGMMSSALNAQQVLQGRVVDEDTGEGVPFATVLITGLQLGTYTDSIGNFVFTGSLPDQFELKVSAALYETQINIFKRGEQPQIVLRKSHMDLNDVIVSSPAGGLKKDNSFRIDHLKINELNAIRSSNLTEAIANINGVQEQSFGAGISKPVIRGMQGSRVLTLVNGVRIENQQWGSDHGMAIGQLGVEAVEVIKGPSSLLYGPDAFGGIVYLIDAPYVKQNSAELEINTTGESVNQGYNGTALFKLTKGVFRFNAGLLYSDYADYKLPDGTYVKNTRYYQRGGKFSLGIHKKNWVAHLRYTLSTARVGLPGDSHDSIPDPQDFIADTGERDMSIPAQRTMNQVVSLENKLFLKRNELTIMVSHTRSELNEFEEKFTIPGVSMDLNNTLYSVFSKWKTMGKWSLVGGMQGSYQTNRNASEVEEELIPDYDQLDNGIYAITHYHPGDWKLQFGLRYDLRNLSVKEASFNKNYESVNFALGAVRHFDAGSLRLNLSSGFRAPHVSELLSDGKHHAAMRYEIGDRDLRSENAYQIDFSYETQWQHIELIVNPFYSYILNYISLEQSDSLIENTPVFMYRQTPEAALYGVDAGFHYHPHFAHWLHVESSYAYIRASDLDGSSFSLIPQARINSFLKFNPTLNGKFGVHQVTLQHQYYFPQNHVGSSETISVDYHLINLGLDLKWNVRTPLIISLGVKNVLNERYINHLSRLKSVPLASQGRNFYINLNYTIPFKLRNHEKEN